MDVRQRILENVRKQAVIQTRLREIQEDAERLSGDLNRLGGQMDLLDEMILEENGVDLETLLKSDEEFKNQIAESSRAGVQQTKETSQRPQPRPVTARTGNKQVAPPVIEGAPPGDGKTPKPEPEMEVVRTRDAPKIVITDDPPPGPEEESAEDRRDKQSP